MHASRGNAIVPLKLSLIINCCRQVFMLVRYNTYFVIMFATQLLALTNRTKYTILPTCIVKRLTCREERGFHHFDSMICMPSNGERLK